LLTNPLIFDYSVNHGHFEEADEADTDWFIVAAHAEPRKLEADQTPGLFSSPRMRGVFS
jgi:hypothetical protein